MKTKKGIDFSVGNYHTGSNGCYEINGREYNVTGEFYLNAKKNRWEHIHEGLRGGETLIFWAHE